MPAFMFKPNLPGVKNNRNKRAFFKIFFKKKNNLIPFKRKVQVFFGASKTTQLSPKFFFLTFNRLNFLIGKPFFPNISCSGTLKPNFFVGEKKKIRLKKEVPMNLKIQPLGEENARQTKQKKKII